VTEERNEGKFPFEEVRFGVGEMGRVFGCDWDLSLSSLSLCSEFRLS
jgi:hypothetical protein